MNHAVEIRHSTRVPEYSVLCDACHGRMFHDGVLCSKCDGEGRLLIAERRTSPHMSEKGKTVVLAATCVGLLIVAVIASLM
jgi:DnaJ-class molecular chaperone